LWGLVGLGLGDFEQKSSTRDPRLQDMLRVGLLLLLVVDFYFAISQWKNPNKQYQSKFGAISTIPSSSVSPNGIQLTA
jgi:hypothetical protein